jgi:hypothetical protein
MENNLTCEFCNKQFVREKNYLKHKCEIMKRYSLFDTVDGQMAFLAFNGWRRFKKYPPIDIEKFVASRYFKAFHRFAEYSRTQSIPDRMGYIYLMVVKDIPPFFWCDYDIYDMYVKDFDESYTVDKKIEISIETLTEIAERYECSLSDVFNKIPPIDLLKLVTSRRLTPWLLLPSNKFKEFLLFHTTTEEKMLFNTFIDVKRWKKDFEKNPQLVSTIKELNSKLGI